MARQPKLTTKSGMPSGITTRTAQNRRPGISVRSTNQAVTVPMTAQRTVTTTVRLTVFHSNWAVRLRKSSGLQGAPAHLDRLHDAGRRAGG